MSEVATTPTATMCLELESPRGEAGRWGREASSGSRRLEPRVPSARCRVASEAALPLSLASSLLVCEFPGKQIPMAVWERPCVKCHATSNGGQLLLATLLFHSSVPVALNGNFGNYFCLIVQSRLGPCSLKQSIQASVLLFWFPLPLIPMEKEFVVHSSVISNICIFWLKCLFPME